MFLYQDDGWTDIHWESPVTLHRATESGLDPFLHFAVLESLAARWWAPAYGFGTGPLASIELPTDFKIWSVLCRPTQVVLVDSKEVGWLSNLAVWRDLPWVDLAVLHTPPSNLALSIHLWTPGIHAKSCRTLEAFMAIDHANPCNIIGETWWNHVTPSCCRCPLWSKIDLSPYRSKAWDLTSVGTTPPSNYELHQLDHVCQNGKHKEPM